MPFVTFAGHLTGVTASAIPADLTLEMLYSGKPGETSQQGPSFGVSPESFDSMIKAMLDADVSNSTNV